MNSILSSIPGLPILTPRAQRHSPSRLLELDDDKAAGAQGSPQPKGKMRSSAKRITLSSSRRTTFLRKSIRNGLHTPKPKPDDEDEGASHGSSRPTRETPSSSKHTTPAGKSLDEDPNTPTRIMNINYDALEVEREGESDEEEEEEEEGKEEEEEEEEEEARTEAEGGGEAVEEAEAAEATEEEHGEDQDQQEEEYTFKRFLDHRWADNSVEIEVEWERGEITWEPEANLHLDAPDTLFEYWREQGGRPTNPDDPEMYEVLRIRKHNKNRNRLLVEWVGYEPSEASWVPRRVVEETAADVVAVYWESLKES